MKSYIYETTESPSPQPHLISSDEWRSQITFAFQSEPHPDNYNKPRLSLWDDDALIYYTTLRNYKNLKKISHQIKTLLSRRIDTKQWPNTNHTCISIFLQVTWLQRTVAAFVVWPHLQDLLFFQACQLVVTCVKCSNF